MTVTNHNVNTQFLGSGSTKLTTIDIKTTLTETFRRYAQNRSHFIVSCPIALDFAPNAGDHLHVGLSI
jgi:thermostable 8-oxoguanine DNA glycosylase